VKAKAIGYWITTILLALGMFLGGMGQLTRQPQTVAGIVHLGYPPYLCTILGFWKVCGAVAIVIPGFLYLKEWAYAGVFFLMTGAATSHIVCHDPSWHAVVTLTLALLAVASRALRPANRRVEKSMGQDVQSARLHPSMS
jgi:hypothetical protein